MTVMMVIVIEIMLNNYNKKNDRTSNDYCNILRLLLLTLSRKLMIMT